MSLMRLSRNESMLVGLLNFDELEDTLDFEGVSKRELRESFDYRSEKKLEEGNSFKVI